MRCSTDIKADTLSGKDVRTAPSGVNCYIHPGVSRLLGGIRAPLCEMCGTEHSRLTPVSLEGTQLLLCENCSRFGVPVKTPATRRVSVARPRPSRPHRSLPVEEDLVVDLGERIRRSREAKGWKREELARRLNEKVSVIEKLEKGKMRPDDRLVAKVERVLEIRLREKVEEETVTPRSKDRPLTLGDLIRREP